MWLLVSIFLAAGCLGIHLYWKRRAGELERQLASVGRELTEARDELVRAVSQMEAHQAAIFNSMVEGILILDEEGRIQTTNKSLERLFSIKSDIRNKTLMEAFRNHGLVEVYEGVQKNGPVHHFELTLPGIHHTRFVEVNAAAIRDPRDETTGTIFIFHDFTRIKELENVRRDFVANVSHELRTPLTMIKGYVETLIDGAKDDPAVATKFLNTIHKHADRLAFLIEDLLQLSQLESGQPVMHRQVTNLNPIVERVLDELLPAAAQNRQSLENLVDPNLEVNADVDRVEQVLFNLVDNAIKYGRGAVKVSAESLPDAVKVCVSDNGPGIPLDAQERIFERFFRVDKARSREAGGTGLGLSIVKHIVQAHRGRVWVESEPEKGSRFYFTLPREGHL